MPRSYEPLSYDSPPVPDLPDSAPSGRRAVSGRRTALIVGALLLLAAVAAPLVLRRALWLNVEAVLVLWFLVWTGALWWLGYHGRFVRRDWPGYEPLWDRRDKDSSSMWSGLGDIGFSAADLGEGCFGALIVLLLVLAAAFVVGWVVPLLAFLLFTVMRVLLSQAGHRARRVRGRLGASLLVAAGWAAVYTVPLAIAVWALHVLA